MKIKKILAITALIASLNANIVFAVPDIASPDNTTQPQQNDTMKNHKKHFDRKEPNKKEDFKRHQDPLKALRSKKEWVQLQVKEGKITKEKAAKIIARIDAKIKDIEEFNRLPLQQKKDKLINDFKQFISRKVKDGKLPQDKADELIKKYIDKVNKWDGNGYPSFGKRGFGCKQKTR